ncbi:cell division protein ZipA C-terminal FtsZ-binding domain-containing protein [Thiomicrorhabdus sp. Kp2]|uniref:cell division protein ZipA C-terminal FtsZ-binding domain-containing protein n=1 Tax=Thiomicrorhabdus sp. Kp2 TaxID=1123518 RepID=UPI00041548B9|nr:cell division protein ZipA C-terminal FtsZ-binding domain-containing protein [Thiomicrorhabdus sp. Kp2]
MNELQQVLLIFAVVVIAGLYFLSRSRQNTMKKNTPKETENHSVSSEKNASKTSPSVNALKVDAASEALNNLGTPHIPLSESTEKRITEGHGFNNSATAAQPPIADIHNEEINQNQGVLSFGEEFDLPHPIHESKNEDLQSNTQEHATEAVVHSVSVTNSGTANLAESSENSIEQKPKHHVLIVDDPGMTGEVDESTAPADFVKPSFGIPEEELTTKKFKASTNKEPEVYVLLVMSTAQEFKMTDVNQALLGVGLSYSEQGIFVKNDNMGNAFIKVANMLEPGTFPQENLQAYVTPGVAMILELPTTVRAPAAMHDLIIMARKVSQRLNGRLYNMERHLIKESDLQSMRDAALDYESEPIA